MTYKKDFTRKVVRCPKCDFFVFEISLTPEASKLKDIGIVDFCTCPNRRCRYKISVEIASESKEAATVTKN